MKKILILNPLKDLPYWGLTTHVLNIFPKFPESEFASYAFFDNKSFAQKSLHQLPICEGFKGFLGALKEMQKLQPDILYGTGSIVELFFFWKRPHHAKYVLAWHGPYDKEWILSIGDHSLRSRISFYIASYLLSRATLLTCDSEYIAESLRKAFPRKKILVTLNGVDGKFFNLQNRNRQWLLKKLSIALDRPTFIFMGHLIKRKRPMIFVELAKRFPEAYFILAGREGFYTKANVEEWEKKTGNLKWFPYFERNDTAKLLSSSEGLIFPSLDEPFGLSVVEAMASGAPVVATLSGALPELIENGKEGVLISEGEDETNQYEAAIRLFATRNSMVNEMITQARAKVENIFNWEDVAKRYENAFREV